MLQSKVEGQVLRRPWKHMGDKVVELGDKNGGPMALRSAILASTVT